MRAFLHAHWCVISNQLQKGPETLLLTYYCTDLLNMSQLLEFAKLFLLDLLVLFSHSTHMDRSFRYRNAYTEHPFDLSPYFENPYLLQGEIEILSPLIRLQKTLAIWPK
jgi:hypothetical protein